MDKIRRIIDSEVKEVEGEKRVLVFTGSDETLDRMDEIIRAEGWQLKNYKKNPVFQWVHNYSLPPLGKSRRTWIDREEKKLKFEIEFAGPDIEYPANMPSPETVYQLYKGGFLRAVSVGFIPIEHEEGEGSDEDYGKPSKKPRRIYTKQDLLELSAVPVPANPNALQEAETAGFLSKTERKTVEEWVRRDSLDKPEVDPLVEEGEVAEPVDICTFEELEGNPEEKPYPNEHACRLRDPKDFQEGSFRRMKREHEGKEYSVIMGRLKGEDSLTDQAFRYKKDVWEVSEARAHCKDHKGSFEPAGESSVSQALVGDELDYLIDCVREVGLNADAIESSWELVREIMRIAGDDIPVDISEKVGAVLNTKNRERLAEIKRLAQEVLDSAEKPDEHEEEEKEIPPPIEETWTDTDSQEVVSESIRRLQGKLD